MADDDSIAKLAEAGAKLDRRDTVRHLLEVRMFEMLDDAILVVCQSSEIVLANPAAELLFLYRMDELVGMNVNHLVPERLRSGHAKHVTGFFEHPRARQMGSTQTLDLNITAMRKDGKEIPMIVSLSPLVADELLTVVVARRRQGAVA